MVVCARQVEQLLGDPSKARRDLGWECKVRFEDLVDDMMKADLASVHLGEHDHL
jgi:GDPmannose 4,6-dehydratase